MNLCNNDTSKNDTGKNVTSKNSNGRNGKIGKNKFIQIYTIGKKQF